MPETMCNCKNHVLTHGRELQVLCLERAGVAVHSGRDNRDRRMSGGGDKKVEPFEPNLVKVGLPSLYVENHAKLAKRGPREEQGHIAVDDGCPDLDDAVAELESQNHIERGVVDLSSSEAVGFALLPQLRSRAKRRQLIGVGLQPLSSRHRASAGGVGYAQQVGLLVLDGEHLRREQIAVPHLGGLDEVLVATLLLSSLVVGAFCVLMPVPAASAARAKRLCLHELDLLAGPFVLLVPRVLVVATVRGLLDSKPRLFWCSLYFCLAVW